MNDKCAIDLTEKAKRELIKWYDSNTKYNPFETFDFDALFLFITSHPRFGENGFDIDIYTLDSKDGKHLTYTFELTDYVFDESI